MSIFCTTECGIYRKHISRASHHYHEPCTSSHIEKRSHIADAANIYTENVDLKPQSQVFSFLTNAATIISRISGKSASRGRGRYFMLFAEIEGAENEIGASAADGAHTKNIILLVTFYYVQDIVSTHSTRWTTMRKFWHSIQCENLMLTLAKKDRLGAEGCEI